MSYCQLNSVTIYVVAQTDEWQLFMGKKAYNDLEPDTVLKNNKRVVFVYLTGDNPDCDADTTHIASCKAKHLAANNAVEFCSDQHADHRNWDTAYVTINGHGMLKYRYRNVLTYYLYASSGCRTHSSSLKDLYDGNTRSLMAVDSSSSYKSREDLTATLHEILLFEKDTCKNFTINTSDTISYPGCEQHYNNIYTGKLVLDAFNDCGHGKVNLFTEHNSEGLPVNLPAHEIAIKCAILGQYDYTITELGLPSEWTPQRVNYCGRSYYRTIVR